MRRLTSVESRTRIALLVAICALTLPAARAEDWTTTSGKTYRNVKVLAHTSTTITVLDSNGGATIDLIDLPPAIQQKYGFDRNAALAIKAKADADAAKVVADKKAAEDKKIADDKAAKDAVVAAAAAQAKDAAEDQKQLESFTAKAKTDYASVEKTAINGVVHYLTREHEDVPMKEVHVGLYSYDQAHAALDIRNARGGVEQKKLESMLAEEKAKCLKAYDAADDAADALAAVKNPPAAAPPKTTAPAPAKPDPKAPAAKAPAAAPTPAAKKPDEAKLAAAKKAADDAANAAVAAGKACQDGWTKYYSYVSRPYYAAVFADPIVDVITDTEGKFTMQFPKTGSWVLVAQGKFPTATGDENCLWIAKINPEAVLKNQVALNNDNLSGDDSLMTAMSDADITTLAQKKVSDLRPK